MLFDGFFVQLSDLSLFFQELFLFCVKVKIFIMESLDIFLVLYIIIFYIKKLQHQMPFLEHLLTEEPCPP
jgi:hypothetical protein